MTSFRHATGGIAVRRLTSCCAAGQHSGKRRRDAEGPSAPAKVRHRFQTKLRCRKPARRCEVASVTRWHSVPRWTHPTRARHCVTAPGAAIETAPQRWFAQSRKQRLPKLPTRSLAPRAWSAAMDAQHACGRDGAKRSTLRCTSEHSSLTSCSPARFSASSAAKVRTRSRVGLHGTR